MRVMTQKLNASNDAILTKWETFDAMITSRAQPASALVALNHCWVFRMVAAVHHGPHSPIDYSARYLSASTPASTDLSVRLVSQEALASALVLW